MPKESSNFARSFMAHVFDEIKHGDDEHRNWLQGMCQKLEQALDRKLEIHKTIGTQHTTELNTGEYREAVSYEGEPLFLTVAYDWKDKPHRLVYDLCNEIDALRAKLNGD